MAFLEDLAKGSVSSILVGVGVALAAPIVLPAVASGFRPVAKAVVKGGIMVYDGVRETVAEAGEQISDLIAEARAEAEHGAAEGAASAAGAATGTAAGAVHRTDKDTAQKK